MADPLPTFVIGAGQAGISVLNALSQVPKGAEEDAFAYYAIDTDANELSGTSPGKAKTRFLPNPSDYIEGDIQRYPYLTADMSSQEKGAQRQRPVGRYKVDNKGTPDIDTIYQDDLYNTIDQHYQSHEHAIRTRERGSFNIFFIHSIGGGTGSGSFPLLSMMIRRVAQELQAEHGVHIYLAGIGVAPRFKLESTEVGNLPGDNVYYPNSYSSLRDLTNLLSASGSDPHSVTLWARESDEQDRDDGVVGNYIEIDEPAFDNYWLVGVEEDKMTGEATTFDIENYPEYVDNKIAESLFALSNYSGSVENWSRDNSRLARLGTFGQAEVTVPAEEIQEYVDAKARKANLKQQKNEGLPEKVERIEEEKAKLEAVQRDPEAVLTQREDDEDLKGDLETTLKNQVGTGGTPASKTPEDFRSALDAVDKQYDLQVQLLAVTILEDLLEHPQGAIAIENAWKKYVRGKWRDLQLSSKPKYGGKQADTVKQKQEGILRFIDDQISEWEEEIDDLEDRGLGIGGKLRDVAPGLETEIQKRESWIDQYQDIKDQLLEHKHGQERIEGLRDELDDARDRVRDKLTTEINSCNEEIQQLQSEIERIERELRNAQRTIEDRHDDLTDDGRYGKRKVILPLVEGTLDDLTKDRFEELNSIADFIDAGFVDETLFNRALEQRYEAAKAWEDPIMDRDMAGIPAPDERNEVWFLYHEDNEDYAMLGEKASTGTFRDPNGNLEYIDDPYRMSFVTITNRGPVEGLELFQELEYMADDGQLDDLSDFDDYRLTFGYPEWYGKHIQDAFDIQRTVEVTRPPELDRTRVRAHSGDDAKQKNYLVKNGIDAYVWQGIHWDQYAPSHSQEAFDGWKGALTNNAVEYQQFVQATPGTDLKRKWLTNSASWQDLLDAYRDNLVEEVGVDVELVDPGE